jgi:hypothetical protein
MKFMPLLLLAMLPYATLADDVVPVEKVKDSVNIRLGPDAASDVVGRLRQGESLPLVKAVPGWYEVQLDGDATGYISADWSLVVADSAVDETAADARVEGIVEPVAEEADVEVVVEKVITEVIEEDPAEGIREVVDDGIAEVGEDIIADAPDLNITEVVEEVVEAQAVGGATEGLDMEVVAGPSGPAGPPGPPGAANIKGNEGFLVKFRKETEGGNSQIYDDGNKIGIGTTEPKQRLEVNGSIQIHEQNSSVAGLMITQSSGDTGYIMHNRASTLTIGAGSQDRITVDRDGNVGIGVSRPSHPLEMASGAHVSAGGVWTNSSSRDKKENIATLSVEKASAALMQLEPVSFNYRNERQEDYLGFLAEDVPDLVANHDRSSLSTMDIVAVLTKVVQAQQQKIEELEARLDEKQAGH